MDELVTPPVDAVPDLPSDGEALDAYSRIVTSVAERLAPSVANLRVRRRGRRREAVGGGSAVVLSGDGFMLTCAHVVGADDAPAGPPSPTAAIPPSRSSAATRSPTWR